MTNADLIQTYVDLLIIEYSDPNNQPRALATIALQAQIGIANQIVGQVGAAYSITTLYGQTTAQGVQIDVLAQFVGAQRYLPGYIPPGTVYGFQDTTVALDPSIGGMGDTTIGPPTDIFASTTDVPDPYTLSDASLIMLILYLADANNAYLSVSVIDDILFDFFGAYVKVEETATMQLTYLDSFGDPNANFYGIIKYLGAFHHPAGVQIIA